MAEPGFAVEFNVDPQGSELDVAATATDTVLYLGDASDYDAPSTVRVDNGTVVADVDVVALDIDAGTITLGVALGIVADVGDRVYILSGGEIAYDYTLEVHLDDGEAVEIPIEYDKRASWVAGPLDPPWPVLVSDDLTTLLDVPGMPQAITGEALMTATVSSDALTTSAAGDDIVNGTFEDWSSVGWPFTGWRDSWWFGTFGDAATTAETSTQIAGTVSAAIVAKNDTAGVRLITDRTYPCWGGQQVTVECQVKANRSVDRSASSSPTLVEMVLHTSNDDHDPEEFSSLPDVVWQVASLDKIDTTIRRLRLVATVPDGHTQMRFSVGSFPSGDGSGWTLIVDEFHKSPGPDQALPQRIDTLDVGTLSVDSTASLIIGGRTLADILADYTRSTSAPTVTTFTATAVRSYDPAGAAILDGTGAPADGYARTGYVNPTGNRTAVVNFDSTAIAAALSGKTISKVEAYLFISSRGGAGDGTIPVGFHSSATAQSTYGAVTGKVTNVARPTGWREGSGKWVDITSTVGDWQTGTKKGLILGPGQSAGGTLSNSLVYSHHITGMGTSTPPKVRFTYT